MISPLHRQVLTAVAILGGMGLALFVSNHLPSGTPKQVSNDNFTESSRPKAEGRVIQDWLLRLRAYPNKSLPPGTQEKEWRASMKAAASQSFSLDDLTGDHWSNIGPASVIGGQIEPPVVDPNPRVSARIYDIAVDPNDVDNHWFIAVQRGGIWETTNGGGSWTPKTDGEHSLAMKTITIAPSDPQILFATTSDTTRLLKSINGGATWTQQFTFPNAGAIYFAGLEVHPTHPNIVMAMIYNGVQANGGVYKSIDGGANFAQTQLVGPGTDLAINPQNFSQQYAAVRSQNAGENVSYNGIYRSLDVGNTWTRLTGISGPWEPIPSGWGVRVAIAPSDPNTVYVVIPGGDAQNAPPSQLWKTANAWATTPTWTALPNCVPGAETVIVDPTDPTILYIGAGGSQNFFRISGSCASCPCPSSSWASIQPGTHVDNFVLKAAGSTILVGNDGGLWSSSNRGTSWYNKNSNLSTIEFYAGSLHPTRGNWALGGNQDNGTELWNSNQTWNFVWGGDGGYNALAYSDPDNKWLVSALDGANTLHIYKVVNGIVFDNVMTGIDRTGAAVIAPIRRSPHNDIVLAAADNLFKSTDFFTAANPTWFVNSPEMGANNSITAIAFAPSATDSLTYAFGTLNGELRLTTRAGSVWRNLDPPDALHPTGTVPSAPVMAIAFHPTDPNTIYVALSGTQAGHVFKTTNGLSATPTWQNVSMPEDLPINALAIDPANPNFVYGAANLGVWKSTYGGGVGSWSHMGPETGMPNVPVNELVFGPDGRLVAFTQGRGAFKLNVGSLQVTITPPAAVFLGAKWNVDGGPFQYTGTILPGLAPGNHTVTFSPVNGYLTPANQTVTITANQTTQASGVYQGGL